MRRRGAGAGVAVALLAVFIGTRSHSLRSGQAWREAVRLDEARPAPALSGANGSGTTAVGTAPMFAVSPAGQEAAAWVTAAGGGTDGRLAVSVDGAAPVLLGDSLGPIEAHGESPPKIVYGPDGALDALYVVPKVVPGKRFPLAALRFVRSTDGGKSWSAPVSVTDDSLFASHNFHSLHASADGTIFVSWLDGRGGKSATYVTRSTDGGKTWAPNVRVAPNGESCPCCRTALASDGRGAVYVAWRMVYPGNVRDIVVARSADGGATWGEPVRVHADDWVFDGCPHAGPSLGVDERGRVHIAWWTGKDKAAGVYYARSDDGARTFGAPVPLGVAEFSKPAHVQLALRPGGTLAAAWDDGTMMVPRVVLRVSRDGGAHWTPAQTLSADGRAAGFPVLALSARADSKHAALTVAWSEESAAAAAAEASADPHAKGAAGEHAGMQMAALHPVGDAQVMVRRGTLR